MFCVLNEINETQKKMSSALNDIVNDVSSINKSTKNIEKLSSITAYNTAKTAYYSEINSKVLNAVKWLVVFK